MPFTTPVQRCLISLAVALLAPAIGLAQVPTFEVIVPESKVNFHVNASVELTGVFEKWAASLRFTTPFVQSGHLEIIVQAASVNAGSSLKRGKLKGGDFFDVKQNPEIKFISKKITLTGQDSYRVDGDITIGASPIPRASPSPTHLTIQMKVAFAARWCSTAANMA